MLKKILLGLGALVGLIVLGIAGVFIYASYRVNKSHELPLPKITRATSPEDLARGERIFRTACAACHTDSTGLLVGQQMKDLPEALGIMYTANLTSDPEFGIGAWTDEELARMIIHAIDRNGKVRPMIAFMRMADEDVAAVIGFMRSGHPDFAPQKKLAPDSQPTALGNVVMGVLGEIHDKPRKQVALVPRGPTAEYGAYAANSLYDCFFCHSAGLTAEKFGPDMYAGGFEFDLASQGIPAKVYSPNITPHPTAGIGAWTLDDFKRAMREGIAKDGSILRPPMGRYRYLDDVDLEAIYSYLKTVPASAKPTTPSTMPREKVNPTEAPEKLFAALGCEFCHGPNKLYTEKLKGAAGKPPEEIAKWIRNPESFKPGTQMPSYAALLDEGQAVELAKWVLATKVSAP